MTKEKSKAQGADKVKATTKKVKPATPSKEKKEPKKEEEINNEPVASAETPVVETPAAVQTAEAPVREQSMQSKAQLEKDREAEVYKNTLPKFNGSTDGLETIIVNKSISNVSWNQHLPCPLQPEEVVFKHPDQTDVTEKSVRIIHGEKKNISIFSYDTLNGPKVVEPRKSLADAEIVDENATEEEGTATETPRKTAVAKPAKVEKPKAGVTFMDKLHSKSGAVLAITKHFVDAHPKITLKKLKEAYPDTLLRRFGIVQEISEAKKIANGGARYFFKPEHQITLADGTVLVVCNQITSDNIKPFIEASRAHGYDVTVQE